MMPPSYDADEDTTVLLNELREISNKYSNARKEPKNKDCHEIKERQEVDQNQFLQQTCENSDLNQYWYSKPTIDALCDAIRESCEMRGDTRVAFLSTPSLYFSLSERERKGCVLFDVSN